MEGTKEIRPNKSKHQYTHRDWGNLFTDVQPLHRSTPDGGSTTERSGHIPPFLTHKHSPSDYHLQMKINFLQGSLSGKTNCPIENEFNDIFEGKFLVSYHVRAFPFVFKFILFICNFSHLFLSLQILCQHIMAYSLVRSF